jgi:hypothetical protein
MNPTDPTDLTAVELQQDETIVRIKHIRDNGQPPHSQDNPRHAFWRPFLIAGSQRQLEITDDRLEARIRSSFSQSLKSLLEGIANRYDASPDGQRRAAAVSAVVIETRIIKYSSMELGLTFEPISKVVDAFEGRYEYFVAFLGMYMPLAFQRSLHGNWYPGEWEDVAGQLSYEIKPASSLRSAFDRKGAGDAAATSKHSTITAFDKARWAWVLANTSLIVPTVLAALYLYILSSHMHERETELDKAYQELVRVQLGIIHTAYGKSSKPIKATSTVSASAHKEKPPASKNQHDSATPTPPSTPKAAGG